MGLATMLFAKYLIIHLTQFKVHENNFNVWREGSLMYFYKNLIHSTNAFCAEDDNN